VDVVLGLCCLPQVFKCVPASLTHSPWIARTLQCPRAGRSYLPIGSRRATAAVASDGGDACSNYPDRGSPKSSRGVAAPARSGKPFSLFESRTPWPLRGAAAHKSFFSPKARSTFTLRAAGDDEVSDHHDTKATKKPELFGHRATRGHGERATVGGNFVQKRIRLRGLCGKTPLPKPNPQATKATKDTRKARIFWPQSYERTLSKRSHAHKVRSKMNSSPCSLSPLWQTPLPKPNHHSQIPDSSSWCPSCLCSRSPSSSWQLFTRDHLKTAPFRGTFFLECGAQ